MNIFRILISAVVLVAVFGAGFFLGRFTANLSAVTHSQPKAVDERQANTGAAPLSETFAQSEGDAPASVEPGAISVDSSHLSDGQRALLHTLGIDPDTIVITAEVIACAEAAVGVERLTEIQNGATPGPIETVRLLACYNSN